MQSSVRKTVERSKIGTRGICHRCSTPESFRHELSVEISNVFYWTDSQVVLDWIGFSKKQPVFVANRIAEIKLKNKPDNWNHIATNLNPADNGTRGLEPKEIEAKWFKPPDFLSTNDVFCRPTKQMPICAATTRSALRTKTPVLDPKQFSTWTKILLTIATVFNLIYRAKKQRDNHHQYTVEDVELSKSYLIQMSQVNSFPTVIELLKGSRKLSPKLKHRSLNPMLDKNGILRVCGTLIFAPSELELAKWPILLHAKDHICRLYIEHAHRICVHQGTEATKTFVQQRYYVIGLRRTLQGIRYKCFLCRRFEPQNIETFMAPLPDCRFPTENKQFTFANCGLDFFGPFSLRKKKINFKNTTASSLLVW